MTAPALFADAPATGWTLWYRPNPQPGTRRSWEAVAVGVTYREAVAAIAYNERRHGEWCVKPEGERP